MKALNLSKSSTKSAGITMCCSKVRLLSPKTRSQHSRHDIFAGSHQETFAELNESLSQASLDLNLGLNVKQVFDPSLDKADEETDLADLRLRNEEILTVSEFACFSQSIELRACYFLLTSL